MDESTSLTLSLTLTLIVTPTPTLTLTLILTLAFIDEWRSGEVIDLYRLRGLRVRATIRIEVGIRFSPRLGS